MAADATSQPVTRLTIVSSSLTTKPHWKQIWSKSFFRDLIGPSLSHVEFSTTGIKINRHHSKTELNLKKLLFERCFGSTPNYISEIGIIFN